MAAKDNKLHPVYFFIGEDALKRGVAEDRLRARIAKLGDIDFNSSTFDGSRDAADAVVSACRTLPFLSPYRFVLLRHADALPAAQAKVLAAYVADPEETTVLAISANSLDAKTVLGKAFAKAPTNTVVDCSIGDPAALARSIAVGHGTPLSPEAAAALVELVGKDTVRLDAEIVKLGLSHEGNQPISEQEVRSQVSPVAPKDVKPWEMLDAISVLDERRALTALAALDDGEMIRTLGLISGRLKELLAAKSSSCPTQASLAAALGKKDWQVKNLARWASRIPTAALESAVIEAADVEAAMKSGSDQRDALTLWLCSFFRSARLR